MLTTYGYWTTGRVRTHPIQYLMKIVSQNSTKRGKQPQKLVPHLTTPVFRVPNECTGPWLGPSPLGDHSTPPPPVLAAPFFLLVPTIANAPPRPPSPPPAAAAAAAAAFICSAKMSARRYKSTLDKFVSGAPDVSNNRRYIIPTWNNVLHKLQLHCAHKLLTDALCRTARSKMPSCFLSSSDNWGNYR